MPGISRSGPGPLTRRELAALATVWVGSALYLWPFVARGWIANDEGMLGHAAERVLRGELPHVDFRELYTGGLSFWHALAFRMLGVDVLSTRWFLYGASLVFVLVVFRLARRTASPLGAAGLTALALVWSVPNYFSAMPSWYVLFLGTAAILAFAKHVETGRRCWLVSAGIVLGLAFLVKSTGLLLLAAALLFLVFREQELDREQELHAPAFRRAGAWPYRLFVSAGLGSFVVVLVSFFQQRPGPMEIILHVLPATALSATLVGRVWLRPSGPASARFGRLLGSGFVFLLGWSLPVLAFLTPYALRGELGSLLQGEVLFQPERLKFGVWSLPGPATLVCALPLAVLFAWPFLGARRRGLLRDVAVPRTAIAFVALVATVVLALSYNHHVYQTVWFALRPLVPILVLSGVAWLLVERSAETEARQRVFLLLAMTALAAISQFPYARAVYFCYVAPLVALSWSFLAGHLFREPSARALHKVLATFFGFFALLWLNLGWIETMDFRFQPADLSQKLTLERAHGLAVPPGSARLFGDLLDVIDEHSRPGDYIFASPDAPEIYFLSNRRNPTGVILDYLDADFGSASRSRRLLDLLDEYDVEVVVLRRVNRFSPLSPDLAQRIEGRYPKQRAVGQFTVHWR